MKEAKCGLVLELDEYRILIRCLIHVRNALIAEGKYTDVVDELILKLDKCKSHNRWYLSWRK